MDVYINSKLIKQATYHGYIKTHQCKPRHTHKQETKSLKENNGNLVGGGLT